MESKIRPMKENIEVEYFRRVRKLLKSKLNSKNVITAINSRAVSIIKYRAGIVEWRKDELQSLDRKTRKSLTMYNMFHRKGDVDRL